MKEIKIKENATVSFARENTTNGISNRIEMEKILALFGSIVIETESCRIRIDEIGQNQFSSPYEAKAKMELTMPL